MKKIVVIKNIKLHKLTTISFIRTIITIVNSITSLTSMNANTITPTLELITSATYKKIILKLVSIFK